MTKSKEIIHHPDKQNNGIKEQTSSGFLRFSLYIMAHSSTLLPYIWVCKLYWFPHRGKKERKRCSFQKSHVFLDCPQKMPAGNNPGKRIYNHSVKPQDPLLERNRVQNTRLKKTGPALNWRFQHLTDSVCACANTSMTVAACCSLSLGHCLVLWCFFLQAALADDGQRVSFCVEDPVIQWDKVVVGEEQVQIPVQTQKASTSLGDAVPPSQLTCLRLFHLDFHRTDV